MTRNHIAKAVAALILTSFAGIAAAGGTQDINVSATVTTVCKFTTGAAIAMTFADIDPSGTGDKTQTVSVPYKCTKGTADGAVVLSGATTTLTKAGGATMTYSLDAIGALGSGNGFAAAATTFDVTGRITQANYADAEAGTYLGTVTLTINH